MNATAATLEELEIVSWAYYLDSKKNRAFEAWLLLWNKRNVLIPNGPWEVDHFDRDKLNDDISNLKVILKSDHTRLDCKRVKLVEIECARCGEKAFKSPNFLRHNSNQGKAGPFCDRVCAGRYGADVQKGKNKLPGQPTVKSEYFYKDK